MGLPKVHIMRTYSGRVAAEQYLIYTDNETIFQSYDSIIAVVPDDSSKKTILGKNWKFSSTTSKYRNKFLGGTTKETESKLASGEYELSTEF